MTTGTRSVGSDGYSTYYEYRNWSGTDGRYEVSGGVIRDKWNNYSNTRISLRGKASTTGNTFSIAGSDTSTAWSANDTVELQSKLLRTIRGHQFNLGVALAEGRETVSMVHSTALALAGCIRSLRRGNFRMAAEHLRLGNERHIIQRLERGSDRMPPYDYVRCPTSSRIAASNDISGRWLELQYGWLPLLNDCYEAGTAFATIANRPRRTRVQVSRTRRSTYNASVSPSNWSGWTNRFETRRYIYEISEDLSIPRELGLEDPLTIGWELIPYSFVVDWFVPIGTYLENLNQLPKLKGRTLTCSYTKRDGKAVLVNKLSPYYIGAASSRLKISYSRTVSTGLVAQRPTFVPIEDALSPKRIANAIALMTQAVLK